MGAQDDELIERATPDELRQQLREMTRRRDEWRKRCEDLQRLLFLAQCDVTRLRKSLQQDLN
jgi:hypothetical protein